MDLSSMVTRYPLKAVYTIATVLALFGKVPCWILRYSAASSRPHSSWTLRQTICTKLIQEWQKLASTIEFQFPQSLNPGNERERWVIIPPTDVDSYRSPLNDPVVKPAKIGGFWYPEAYLHERDHSRRVILHIHGGAFVVSDAREMSYGFAAKVLHDATSATAFLPDYRLASTKGNRFPAALQDSLSAYVFLLDQGIPPANIILSGDSAGGNLAIGLLRYLSDNTDIFPTRPYALLLWSPWLDLSVNFDEHFAQDPRAKTDFLDITFLKWGRRAYKPPELPASDPYISPGRHPFRSKTPIWMHLGGLEVLRGEIMRYYEAMMEVKEGPVALDEMKNEPHDVLAIAHLTGKEEQGRKAASQAASFLNSLQE